MTDPLGRATDARQTIVYASAKIGRKFVWLGMTALVAGAILLWLQPADFGPFEWMMLALTLAVGAACTGYGLHRWLKPKPMLTLSPAGLRLHIDMVKDVLIPWDEIRGVDSIDISGKVGRHFVHLPGVTVVLVTRTFYDSRIHVDSWFMRGPGWETNFIPKGDLVQVALHHDALPASAADLRTAVETRWRAFAPERNGRNSALAASPSVAKQGGAP